jgi:Flp pilus assembly protein TadG
MRNRFRRLVSTVRGRERAQTLAEFAMIAPVLFLLIFSVIDAARMMQSYVTIQGAAREGARYAVTGRTECDGLPSGDRETCIVHVAEQTAGNLEVDQLTVTMRSWAFTEGGYAATATDNDAGIQCDNVEVAVSYEYDMITPMIDFFIPSVTMSASERLVNEPFGACAVPDV